MFLVLHSSAGAGKTHALVKHYLTYCLRGEDHGAYRQVLALTFTNKAAAEMKERVIGYLERLAEPGNAEGPVRDVIDHLTSVTAISEQALATRAHAVLGHMLHNWSDVAISTIDAFTRRVVRPFTRDLRLDHDLRMTTEQTYYRERAVQALIDAAGSDERITAILSQACLQLLHEERSWDPAKPLLDLSHELLKESSIAPLERLRSFSAEELGPLTERLNRDIAVFRQQVRNIGREALQSFAAHGLTEADVAHGKGGVLGYFRKLARFADVWDAPGPQTLKPFETGKWHSGKATPTAIAALDGLADRLTALFQRAEELRTTGLRDHFIQRSVVRELLPAFALHELDVKLEALKTEDGVTFFSDLTRRVAEVVKNEPVPFIYERLGERYRHFLIDEFQDTSLLQWNALLPLIENALANGGSTLLVGDAKQAIYRWRNGEVRLFVELPQLFGRDPADDAARQRQDTLERYFQRGERLAHNRRSAQRIIAFNNALHGALAKHLQTSLQKVYDAHDQRTSHTDLGAVHIEPAETGLRGEALQEALLANTLRWTQEAVAAGFGPGDIAVLVRSKRTGRAVAKHLLQNGYPVVSPDGSQLAADPGVQLLTEWLRFLHTGEEASAVRVLQWRTIVLGTASEAEFTDPFHSPEALPKPVAQLRQWLRQNGDPRLRTTIVSLVSQLARLHSMEPAEDASVLTLLDEIHAWTTEHAQDIGAFLEHWDRSGGERSAAAAGQGQAVQVMTVHKSKGLQFPVVIVPDTRMAGNGDHGELFWIKPGEAVPELEVALIREGKLSKAAELEELQEEEGLRHLDALNLLYVAFTRPEQRLYAFVPEASDIITKALRAFVVEHPELARTDAPPETPRKQRSPSTGDQLRGVRGASGSPKVTLRFEAPDDWDPAHPDPARAYGTAVHQALERTLTADQWGPSLQAAVAAGDLTTEQASVLLERLGPWIASDTMAPWFGPGLDVRAEAALITADGHALRPDRLIIEGDNVRVLEIKTGRPADAHARQLRTYLQLLRELGYPQVDGTIWYVGDGHLEHVA
ncbi:MAG: UvrD-helicase domain-containing protein [Flavobacteriales bacterium]|nr:UvrD-helicase domain-containing protein [Flavobacteriales bacterium]